MFLNSSLPSYAVAIIIVAVVVQYAYALFCLLKLAYIDIPKKQYVLWNLLILLGVFVGPTIFLVYYYKIGKEKKIPPYVEEPQGNNAPEQTSEEAGEEPKEQVEQTDVKPEADDKNTD